MCVCCIRRANSRSDKSKRTHTGESTIQSILRCVTCGRMHKAMAMRSKRSAKGNGLAFFEQWTRANGKFVVRQRLKPHRHQRQQQHVHNTLSLESETLHAFALCCAPILQRHISVIIIIMKVNGQAKHKQQEYEYSICMRNVYSRRKKKYDSQ